MTQPKIAICISTHNRPETFREALTHQSAMLPLNARIFVVDDASESPVACADFRFEQNAGIARTKNKCLELAADWGAEHIFLFDDDCWPIVPEWWKPYVYGRELHYMYIFNQGDPEKGHRLKPCMELYRDAELVAYSHIRGCMLYIDRKVLASVGGFDVRFGRGMYEHGDYSNRIHMAGLTTYKYQDVPGSNELIYSMDEHGLVDSTISKSDRAALLNRNRPIRDENLKLTPYREYRGGAS